MDIYAISDLHLSFCSAPDPPEWKVREYKPMSEINGDWSNHAQKIYENWLKTVGPFDLVLLPGDISWAMNLEEAEPDISFMGMLPGNIVAVQGNHDYWWQGITKVRKKMPANVNLIQNDCIFFDNLAICGSRGWFCPAGDFAEEKDSRIYNRELIRMENSLSCATAKVDRIIVIMHFMPGNEKNIDSGFFELFQKYSVETVIYGHLHAQACRYRLPEKHLGINFYLVSADFLKFTPVLISSL